MRDDQLRNLLRTLEEPRDPDPAFADTLFNRLGMVARSERRSRTPFILLAAAVLLVALMAGAAIGSGLVELPFTADASPTPSASAPDGSDLPAPSTSEAPSPAPSASGAPSPSPSAELVGEAGELGVPEGLLPAGSVVIATADGLRIREAPTTDAAIVATVRADDALYVVDSITAGPVAADGYDWYEVEYADGRDVWPWQDVSPASGFGWVAAGSAAERFVRLAEVTCPAEPLTLAALASQLTSWERLVCLRDGPITIEGTYGCDACTESPPGTSPAWLSDVEQHASIAGQYQYYPFVLVAISPGEPVPTNRDIVRATLRVDDPASATCGYPESEGTAPTPDPMAVEIFCRERLVLDSFEVIGTDDFPGG